MPQVSLRLFCAVTAMIARAQRGRPRNVARGLRTMHGRDGALGDEVTHVRAGEGPLFWGPGDRYRFLITGRQSGGSYFILEALVPPGGGPPLHVHRREEECFFLLEGRLSILVGGRTIDAGAGDFIHFPRGTPHAFRNEGAAVARMLAVFSPAGMEGWFEAALDVATDREAMPPPPSAAMLARMLEAAPRFGVEWVTSGPHPTD
jgi:mannose-6-phosphate isomerase-like protein (cupin superfamily)